MLPALKHQLDETGKVFVSGDSVYRRIFPDAHNATRELLDSRLFAELVEKKLFPSTQVVNDGSNATELVLRHERAPFILHAWEWSFSMLRDAAVMLLDVAEICAKHGYHLHDAHHLNIVFFGGSPVFVDFGSIRKGRRGCGVNVEEFVSTLYLPLQLWSSGNFYIANQILCDERIGQRLLPSAGAIACPLLKPFLAGLLKKRDLLWVVKRTVNALTRVGVRAPLLNISSYGQVHAQKSGVLLAKVLASKMPVDKTEWSKYQDNMGEGGVVSGRFGRILEIVEGLRWLTALDVAGNGGYFAVLLAQRFPKARVLSLDYDSQAVDKCYRRVTNDAVLHSRVTSGLMNVMYPIDRSLPVEMRIGADIVFALALTHHLLLRQSANLDILLEDLVKLARRYLVIEFMPLGLWDTHSAPPVPKWYTQTWFRSALEKRCAILLEEQTEPNRLMYLCEIKR